MAMSPRTGRKQSNMKLKVKVAALQRRAADLQEQAERLGAAGQVKQRAVSDRSRCTGCGLCEELCPLGAIRVTYVANIDAERCAGCGICVENCPQGAIHLVSTETTPATGPKNA